MKVREFDSRLIGKNLTRDLWTDCVLVVEDVGSWSIWGYVFDTKYLQVHASGSYAIDGEWKYASAIDAINSLPMTGRRRFDYVDER